MVSMPFPWKQFLLLKIRNLTVQGFLNTIERKCTTASSLSLISGAASAWVRILLRAATMKACTWDMHKYTGQGLESVFASPD